MHQLKWPLLGLLIIFLIHFIIPSYWNGFALSFGLDWRPLWDNELANLYHYSRLEDPVFSQRLLSNHLLSLGLLLGMPPQFSFILINSVSFIFIQFGLLALAEALHGQKPSMASVSLPFTLSFSVLFGFLASVSSYDDWPQYALLLWGLVAIERRRYLFGLILFVAACCARETSLFFLPLGGWLVYRYTRRVSYSALFMVGIVVMYGSILWGYWIEEHGAAGLNFVLTKRFTGWQYNFQNIRHIRETIGLLFLVLGLPLWMLWRHRKSFLRREGTSAYFYFVLWLVLLNTIIVLIAARVREARLLYLPVLIVLPLVAPYWWAIVINAWNWIGRKQKGPIIVLALVATLFTWGYWPTVNGTGYIFRAYSWVYLFCWGIIVASVSSSKNRIVLPNSS